MSLLRQSVNCEVGNRFGSVAGIILTKADLERYQVYEQWCRDCDHPSAANLETWMRTMKSIPEHWTGL